MSKKPQNMDMEISAVAEMATWTTQKIHARGELREMTKHYLRRSLPKIYTHELLQTIFTQLYCRD